MTTGEPVARIWRGWTTEGNADAYEAVVGQEVLPSIMSRNIEGLRSAHLMRAEEAVDDEVEFTTIIWFDSIDSVRDFMGDDYRRAHVPANAQAVLKRYDAEAKHFNVLGVYD